MAASQNGFQDFQASRRNAANYPHNLLRTDAFEHELDNYHGRLATSEAKESPFHPSFRFVCLLDYHESSKQFSLSEAKGTGPVDQLLQDSMNEGAKDPRYRYLFVQASSSRERLSIAKDQFLLALSHLQAAPAFLDHVFTFKVRAEPNGQASFFFEDHISQNSRGVRIDQLRRSGLQIQHCFNLIGVEKEPTKKWPWLVRQTAVHFSFDLEGGQSAWVILKANGVVRERVKKDLIDGKTSRRHSHDVETPEGSFSLGLRTHLLLFDWCVENWSAYIEYLESIVQRPAALPKHVSIGEMTHDRSLGRMHSGLQSRQDTGLSQNPVSRSTSFLERIGLPRRSSKIQPQDSQAATPANKPKPSLPDVKELFPFEELQALHRNVDRLQNTSSVIAEDKTVIEDIIRRFESLERSHDFNSHVQVDQIDFDRFYQRARACLRELESQLARVQAIIISLDKVISLFNTILEYNNMCTGEWFARQAMQSTEVMGGLTQNMHDLATKTKKETVSMHSITVLTLFFLPGTFVATFFSTGILDFDSDESPTISTIAGHSLGGWRLRPAALRLFLAICVPLMVFVLLLWTGAYLWAQRQQKILSTRSLINGRAEADEKGQATSSS